MNKKIDWHKHECNNDKKKVKRKLKKMENMPMVFKLVSKL